MKSSLVEITEQYVVSYLKKKLPAGAIYHSIDHTQEVVGAVKTLCKEENISDEDTESVLIAAWFHDVGFVEGTENHKEYSVSEALEFLKDQELPMDKLEVILSCIRATSRPVNPQNILEQILCDANLFYLATTNFEKNGKLLRAEWEFLHNKILTDVEWYQCNADFLKEHRYFTNFAFKSWDGMKASNVALTEKKLKNAIQKAQEKTKKKQYLEKQNRVKEAENTRDVEIAYNITVKNHLKINDHADVKIYILMMISSVVLIVVLTHLLPQILLGKHGLMIPSLAMLFTSLFTLIGTVIAIFPFKTKGVFTKEEIEEKSKNILYYGNYHKMSFESFEEGMSVLVKDKDCLYSSLNKDLYFLGKELARKQKKLRQTYLFFVIGIIVSSLAFLIKCVDFIFA